MANSNKKISTINPTVIMIIVIIIILLGVIGYIVYRIIKKKKENHIYIDDEDDNYEYEEIDNTPQNLRDPYVYSEEEN